MTCVLFPPDYLRFPECLRRRVAFSLRRYGMYDGGVKKAGYGVTERTSINRP